MQWHAHFNSINGFYFYLNFSIILYYLFYFFFTSEHFSVLRQFKLVFEVTAR